MVAPLEKCQCPDQTHSSRVRIRRRHWDRWCHSKMLALNKADEQEMEVTQFVTHSTDVYAGRNMRGNKCLLVSGTQTMFWQLQLGF